MLSATIVVVITLTGLQAANERKTLSALARMVRARRLKWSSDEADVQLKPPMPKPLAEHDFLPTTPLTTAPRREVFAVIDAAFAQRRKALRGALSSIAGSPTAAQTALRAAGIEPLARGEQLDVAAFARIAEALERARVAS